MSATIQIKGKPYTINALGMVDFGELSDKLSLLETLGASKKMPGRAEVDAILDLIMCALKEHHADISREQVAREISLPEGMDAVAAIFTASGLVAEKGKGEAPASP